MSIKLHKTKGLNPKLTYCPRCGEDGDELILLGATDRIYKCTYCGMRSIGKRLSKCPECGRNSWHKVGTVGEYDKLPSSHLCAKCEKELAEHKAIVDAGGIYWKCKDCRAEGVIKTGRYADSIREHLHISSGPCGVEFDKDNCPSCSVDTGE